MIIEKNPIQFFTAVCYNWLHLLKDDSCKQIIVDALASLIAIQKGEGAPILPLNKDNLEEMVAENPEALKFAKKKKLERAITTFNK